MRIRPLVGSMSRLTILRLVVLPQPDGPTRTQILPAGTVSDRSLTAPGRGLLAFGHVVVLGDVLELDDGGAVGGLVDHRPDSVGRFARDGGVARTVPHSRDASRSAILRPVDAHHAPIHLERLRRCRSTRRSRRPGIPVPRTVRSRSTLVRVETDEGVVGIGSGDTMDGFEAFAHLFVGQDPLAIARHVRALETIDFHAGRYWPLEVGALGHRRPGRRAAGRDAVRRGARRHPGLRLVRDAAPAPRPGPRPRCACARRASGR